eukprot:TRINITY_DN9462_c0_g1_i1.p1 TRINITY_DN9462_c0_g1~~TRINITY_DN9462_c0_g1_i1.p1  ORF type:complete len:199 (+),score=23.22 TRINITY_DN9462_c0_g1_i1:1-597(+)
MDQVMEKVWTWVTDLISATGAKKMSVSELKNRIGSDLPTLILDVRTPEEQETSCIPKSVLVHPGEDICQRQEFKSFVDKYLRAGGEQKRSDAAIVIYCASTYCSSRCCASCDLSDLADNVFYLDGGIVQWVNEGGSLVSPTTGELVKCLRCSSKLVEMFVKGDDQNVKIETLPEDESHVLRCQVPDRAVESEDPYLNR